MILYEDEQHQFQQICERLRADSRSKSIFLIDVDGQLLASAGEVESVDTTALSSLVAGTMSAGHNLATLVGEKDFPTHYYEGERGHIYSVKVADALILTSIFDAQSSLGLVRMRIKRVQGSVEQVQKQVTLRAEGHQGLDAFKDLDLDDATIDGFFSDAW